MSGKVCLYVHYRADDGLMFYVGIGNTRRPWSVRKRSDWWNAVVAKHGYVVRVLQVGLTRVEAQELERVMIAEWRLAPDWLGRLVNIMDGGEGAHGEAWQTKNAEGKRKMAASPEWQESRRKLHASPEWQESRRRMAASPTFRVAIAIAHGSRPEANANIAYMEATEPHSSLCYGWAYVRVKPSLYPCRERPNGRTGKKGKKLAAVAGRYRFINN